MLPSSRTARRGDEGATRPRKQSFRGSPLDKLVRQHAHEEAKLPSSRTACRGEEVCWTDAIVRQHAHEEAEPPSSRTARSSEVLIKFINKILQNFPETTWTITISFVILNMKNISYIILYVFLLQAVRHSLPPKP